MKTLPTQRRALHKRASLISAAIDEFSTVGFDVATAKTIAASAGVATGTFYQYFENKNDILNVIATERFEFLRGRIAELEQISLQVVVNADTSSAIERKFERVLRLVYEFHAQAPELHQVLEQRRIADQSLAQIMSDGESLVKERVHNFVKGLDVENAEIVAENLFAMGEGIVHRLVFASTSDDHELTIRIGAKMIARYFEA